MKCYLSFFGKESSCGPSDSYRKDDYYLINGRHSRSCRDGDGTAFEDAVDDEVDGRVADVKVGEIRLRRSTYR